MGKHAAVYSSNVHVDIMSIAGYVRSMNARESEKKQRNGLRWMEMLGYLLLEPGEATYVYPLSSRHRFIQPL